MSVILGGTFSKIPGLNHGRFLVAFVHGPDQVGVQVLNLLLNGRLTLDPVIMLSMLIFKVSYLFEFILAEKGLADMFSSIGRLTDGIGMLEMPLSYSRLFKSFFLDLSGTKLFKSIYRSYDGY